MGLFVVVARENRTCQSMLNEAEWFLGFPLSDGGLLIPVGRGEFPIGKLMAVTFSRD